MRRVITAIAVFGALVMARPAMAQENQIEIFLEGVSRGDPGDVFLVHEETVDSGLVGATCAGTALTVNNFSEHPNNDLIISSGGSSAVIPDFEAVSWGTTTMATTVTLGESITVSIRLGGDGVSSEGVLITLNCTPPQTTTTTTPPQTTTTGAPSGTTTTTTPPQTTTTTTPPQTTTTGAPSGTTTTTTPPPEGGVDAGGGSTAAASGGLGAMLLGAGFLAGALTLVVLMEGRRQGFDRSGTHPH